MALQHQGQSFLPPMAGTAHQAIEHVQKYGKALLPDLLAADKLREAREAVYAGSVNDATMGRRAGHAKTK